MYGGVSDNRSKYYSYSPTPVHTTLSSWTPQEGMWDGGGGGGRVLAQAAGRELASEVTKYRNSV